MSQFWENKNGRIAISQMDDSYLSNAIKFCEKHNMELTEIHGGCGSLSEDFWGDSEIHDLSEKYERLKLEVRLRSIDKKLGLVSNPESQEDKYATRVFY